MKSWEDYYEEALDAIRDAQGDKWFAYSAADIQSAEDQANQAVSKSESSPKMLYRIDTYSPNGNWIEAFVGDLELCFDWLQFVAYKWGRVRIIEAVPNTDLCDGGL